MHTPISKRECIHSPCHGILTCYFLLEITQIPSLLIDSLLEEWWGLEEPAVLEVFFDDNICNCIKYKFDILGVCSTGHVTVDFFDIFSHVEVKELTLDIIPCILIRVVSWFSRKTVKKWDKWTLLSYSVFRWLTWSSKCSWGANFWKRVLYITL